MACGQRETAVVFVGATPRGAGVPTPRRRGVCATGSREQRWDAAATGPHVCGPYERLASSAQSSGAGTQRHGASGVSGVAGRWQALGGQMHGASGVQGATGL